MKNNLKILSICLISIILLFGCTNKDKEHKIANTVYVNGTIICNQKIEGTDTYKNQVLLETGEIWEHISSRQLVKLDREQNINKGDPEDASNVVCIVIEALKDGEVADTNINTTIEK